MLSTEAFAGALFWIIVGVTFGGACIAVFPRNIVYNIIGLALALTGVAGIYFYLGSFFVALMQLLIYVGAICISIVFAIMLSRPLHHEAPPRKPARVVAALGASFLTLVALLSASLNTDWTPAAERSSDWSVATIGEMLLTRYALVFELISLVLLVAIVGAILTAGFSRRLSS